MGSEKKNHRQILKIISFSNYYRFHLISQVLIDRKFHGKGKNDEFVLYEYLIKQCSSFCKYTDLSVMKKKKIKENKMSTKNRKYVMFMGNT